MKFYIFIICFSILIISFSCKSYNINVSNEKKFDGSYEMFLEPEIAFAGINKSNNFLQSGENIITEDKGLLLYYQFIYKYPEDYFYMNIYPEETKVVLNIEKIIVKNGDVTSDLQVFKQKNNNNVKKTPEKFLIKIDYKIFDLLKDDGIKTKFLMMAKINNNYEELVFLFENYDKVYLKRFSIYIDDFKIKIDKNKLQKK